VPDYLAGCKQTSTSSTDLNKILQCNISRKPGHVVPCGGKDRQTDRHESINSRVSPFRQRVEKTSIVIIFNEVKRYNGRNAYQKHINVITLREGFKTPVQNATIMSPYRRCV
jgi:hypothetical protein